MSDFIAKKIMDNQFSPKDLFTYTSNNVNRFKRNFLTQAICEIRFPTLLELGEQHPPNSFVKALRKDYPFIEVANEFHFGLGNNQNSIPSYSHIFRSARSTWTVTLRQSSISIETSTYQGYEKMKEKILQALAAATNVIETDFLTRVGLRYINVIDTGEDPRTGWINNSLVSPLQDEAFLSISEYNGRLVSTNQDLGCILQHGLHFTPVNGDNPGYRIDVDSFRTEVNIADAEAVIDEAHAQVFNVFDWCLGEKARSFLSEV